MKKHLTFKNFITLILIVGSIGGIVWSFNFFSKGSLTSNEQILFSIISTLASTCLSWLISHFYYEISHQETIEGIKKDYQSNLKIYASKAAEKVTNLSTEFTKLVNYLSEEYEDDNYESDTDNLHAKRERIYSVIHIVNTLKSINDGSLSDWKGIIPEEIEEIVEVEREKVENISNILQDYKNIVSSSHEQQQLFVQDQTLKDEIKGINQKLDLAIKNVSGIATKNKSGSIKKENVKKSCPQCGALTEYRQKPLLASRKSIKCKTCKIDLDCRWYEDEGFVLAPHNDAVKDVSNMDQTIDTISAEKDIVKEDMV